MNAAVEGKVYPTEEFRVLEDRVAAFRGIVGGPGDVPPTFLAVAEFAVVIPKVIADPELGLDFSRVVHGSQEYSFRRPIRIGETLAIVGRIASIRRKGANGFLTLETEARDADGEVVALARSLMIEREAPR